MRIRNRDKKLALSNRHAAGIEHLTAASDIERHCRRRFAARGYRVFMKSGGGHFAQLSQTFRRTLFLGATYAKKTPVEKAALWVHELGHSNQRRTYRTFTVRYALDARFRWAMECQCERERIRAYRRMGYRASVLREYARKWSEKMPRTYRFRGRFARDVRRATTAIILA